MRRFYFPDGAGGERTRAQRAEVTDAELYDLLMAEYPDWLKAAGRAGLIA